jgi:ABC-2 type transport system permease protein
MLRVGLAEAVAYRGEFVIWILSTNMPIVMLLLWTAVAREQPLGRFGEAEFGAYFLSTLMVRLVTGSWVVWELNFEIRQGTLARRLLRPVHALLAYAAENLAATPFRVLMCLPIVAIEALWLGSGPWSSDPLHWLLLGPALAGAWAMTFTAMTAIGTLALYWESSQAVFRFWLGLFFVLSGYTIPLELFPPWLRQVVLWLPFRFQLSFPVELQLGLVDRARTVLLLGVQWGYAAFFLGLTLLLWRRGLRRYAAYGG